ncbi:glycosyltransferase family 2 protein [Jhaorihella thermophila]|uniref:Glycosyl transferase family 2 n=1 Tax=Jhaorihella thermophila TaxID=488547 RepID=A0A1H5WIE3_9RHOB|nr:glycosyltransferase family 2 protein [Jhaorihella thermophila]SEF99041.1 Glycosyl transferase family 2 [Jhaorihella thermophila]
MRRIDLHIGLPGCGAERIQQVLDAWREPLLRDGVLLPRSSGRRNHTRLYMAVTDPDHVDPLRWNRGHATAQAQARLREEVRTRLAAELDKHGADRAILSAMQLATLSRRSELERLRDLLAEFARGIRVVVHLDEPARVLARHYAEQVLEGRTADLRAELDLARSGKDWRATILADVPPPNPMLNAMPEVQAPPFWLDYAALLEDWRAVFGDEAVRPRAFDPQTFAGDAIRAELIEAFDLERAPGRVPEAEATAEPSAAFLARARQMNALMERALHAGRIIPRQLRRRLLGHLDVNGAPVDPGQLTPVSDRFATANARLADRYPALAPILEAPAPVGDWAEPDPGYGFRATQYFAAFLPRIDAATSEERESKAEAIAALTARAANGRLAKVAELSPEAAAILPPLAQEKFRDLIRSSYVPHNGIGRTDEDLPAPPYPEMPRRELPPGSTGTVIVGCMKNEAPYIVEWVASHRAIGVDNFLIYTNGCEDGTDAILDRLQEMGVLQHRNNDDWKGNSPQQHALNRSLKEDVIRNAEWIAHIDVDEFINVRCGNGTVQDFLDRVPNATNIAMTWRLFGNNGVRELRDEFVIAQFDRCAPRFCPKPHTVWGFKTMFRNIGAYAKISCHRPNKLAPEFEDKVRWVNGSGQDMTREVARNGWRNSKKSIGYDLLQLNHYALRSAESFLIKRQRGRALHVDRSIGLNYWIRMDWSDHRDITIQRNIPRLRAEYDRLMADDRLRDLHRQGLDWHRAKADELHRIPEFEELYQQALKLRLNETERAAWALALDMES